MRDMDRPRAVGLALAAVVTAGLGARAGADTQAWAACDSFDTQPEAQAYWESHGRPAQADGNNDGKICESLPTGEGAAEGCERPQLRPCATRCAAPTGAASRIGRIDDEPP